MVGVVGVVGVVGEVGVVGVVGVVGGGIVICHSGYVSVKAEQLT